MSKEAEDTESPQRSIRDSGYIDCWDSERSDSLSPPRHGREDSFDSLDSFGSRSRQTPSPDVLVTRGIGSDGRTLDARTGHTTHAFTVTYFLVLPGSYSLEMKETKMDRDREGLPELQLSFLL